MQKQDCASGKGEALVVREEEALSQVLISSRNWFWK